MRVLTGGIGAGKRREGVEYDTVSALQLVSGVVGHRGGVPVCSGFSLKLICVSELRIMVGLVFLVFLCSSAAGVLFCSAGRG